MKKAKAKAKRHPSLAVPNTTTRRRPYQKAAIRSQAFEKAIADAKFYAADPQRLRLLFAEASQKAASIPKEPFKDSWPYLQSMLRLIRSYSQGAYRHVSQDALLTIIAALNYLVDPFDLIPDEIPFLGLLDDATVISFAISKTRRALDEFMTWETTSC